MSLLLLAQQAAAAPPMSMDFTAILTGLGGGAGGAMAVYFAMKWVQSINQQLVTLMADRLAEQKAWSEQLKELLRLVLEKSDSHEPPRRA